MIFTSPISSVLGSASRDALVSATSYMTFAAAYDRASIIRSSRPTGSRAISSSAADGDRLGNSSQMRLR